jgi:hypothetical protein
MPKSDKLRFQVSYYNPETREWNKGTKFPSIKHAAMFLEIHYESAKNLYNHKAKKFGKFLKLEKIPIEE